MEAFLQIFLPSIAFLFFLSINTEIRSTRKEIESTNELLEELLDLLSRNNSKNDEL